jgi:lipopolysaccharide export system ATP-binding protein
MTDTVLSAQKISKHFKSRKVVNQVSLSVQTGEIVGLLGPNGAGKTTSFYMMVGLLAPDEGEILLGNERITHLPIHIRAQKGISYLPQNVSIFRKLTVKENLLAVMEIIGLAKKDQALLVQSLLRKFHIEPIANSLGISLSGGERRRVEIARSLIINPKFLLLDEPFAGVDPVTVQEIQGIIRRLKDDGIGILITDHNVRETLGICDRAYVLSGGKIISEGAPEEVLHNQKVREIYLGDNFQL